MTGSAGRQLVQARGSEFDVFVSHASEDKAEVARPLTDVLVSRGLRVWLDEQVLTLGDALGRKIDEGLARSRFGVVILSPHFFAKHWTRRELDGLVARETFNGDKVILPVWHGVTREDVTAASPTLAARLAVDTVRGIERVADEVQRALEAAGGDDGTRFVLQRFPGEAEPHANAASGEPEDPRAHDLLRENDTTDHIARTPTAWQAIAGILGAGSVLAGLLASLPWLVGAPIGGALAAGVLHRQVWRVPPQPIPATAVVAVAIACAVSAELVADHTNERPAPKSTAERLDAVLPDPKDLPAGFTAPLRLPAGAKAIDADELCGKKPRAEGLLDERDAMYTNGSFRTRALFFSIASFRAADASGFLDQLRRLAGSCDHWTYKTPGHPPQTSEILDVSEPDGYGDAAVRVRMHDPQGDSDFLYVQVGNLVGLVAYEIAETKTDPAVIEETGRDMAHRMQRAAGP